jgi:antitoxin ParD1/3/4
MNVSLSPELQNFVKERVKNGSFKSASEVIAEALKAFQEREAMRSAELERLGKEIDIGIEQADRGETVDCDEAFKRVLKDIRSTKGKSK